MLMSFQMWNLASVYAAAVAVPAAIAAVVAIYRTITSVFLLIWSGRLDLPKAIAV